MKTLAVIPARYASTRFPGKPLAEIADKPMIYYVYQRAVQCKLVDNVLVATDDIRIYNKVESFGGWVVLTSTDCPSGTDRIAEAIHKLDYDIIVNIQGDEPLLDTETVDKTIKTMMDDDKIDVATAKIPITTEEDYLSPNVVKVVCDKDGFALYFSRSPIPNLKRADKDFLQNQNFRGYKHLGLYVYRYSALMKFTKLEPSFLEKLEKLEQLRFLENGFKIKLVDANKDSIGVDTPEDLQKVENLLKDKL